MVYKWILVWFLCLVSLLEVTAQFPGASAVLGSGVDTTKIEEPDSLIYKYFYLTNPNFLIDFSDTTLENQLHFDPIRMGVIEHMNLGNVGSSSQPLSYRLRSHRGFHMGFTQYDVYKIDLENFKFYDCNRPVSDLVFSPLAGQQNFVVKADFAQSFNDGISTSLNFQRIRQPGFYLNQDTRNTNFGWSFRFQNEAKTYESFFTIFSNVHQENHNGGITTDTLYGTPFADFRNNIPVFLNDAVSRHEERSLHFQQRFALAGGEEAKWKLNLEHEISYSWNSYKFGDPLQNITSRDSAFYEGFLTDDRGIRMFVKTNSLANTLSLNLDKRTSPTEFKVGIIHERIGVGDELQDRSRNDLSLTFRGFLAIGKKLLMDTEGFVGIGSNAGNFLASGNLDIEPLKGVYLDIGLRFFRNEVEERVRRLVLNGTLVYQNDFSKPVGSQLTASVRVPKLGLLLDFSQYLIQNVIAWGGDRKPIQSSEVFLTNRVSIDHSLRLGPVGFRNTLLLQQLNNELFGLPSTYSRHRLYLEHRIFKKVMKIQYGVEARYMPNFSSNRFFPITGVFFGENTDFEGPSSADVYFLAQVSRFRFFLRFDNIYKFSGREVQYWLPQYPMFDSRFRLGFRWTLLD